jgi:hypothetical protein
VQPESNPAFNSSQVKNDAAPPYWTKERVQKLLTDERTPVNQLSALLLCLYRRQAENEQEFGCTMERNGLGFNQLDAAFLSSVAQWSEDRGGFLTRKQAQHVRVRLKQYVGQLASALNAGDVTISASPNPISRSWQGSVPRV